MRRYRLVRLIKSVLIYLAVFIAVILSVAPIIYLFVTSFKPAELTFAVPPVWNFTPTLQNYRDVFAGANFTKYFFNSFVIASTTT